jgi:hypothetical protein
MRRQLLQNRREVVLSFPDPLLYLRHQLRLGVLVFLSALIIPLAFVSLALIIRFVAVVFVLFCIPLIHPV